MREDEGMCLLLKEWFDSASGSPVGLRTIYLLAWDSVRQLRIACPSRAQTSSRTMRSASARGEGPLTVTPL